MQFIPEDQTRTEAIEDADVRHMVASTQKEKSRYLLFRNKLLYLSVYSHPY